MRSAPVANRTRHVGSVTCAWYRKTMSLTSEKLTFSLNPFWESQCLCQEVYLLVAKRERRSVLAFHAGDARLNITL